jgi:lysophospholipid acyltransferase (LPLAT)-like uncharacterized protein
MNLRKIKQNTLRFAGNFFLFSGVNVLCKALRITYVNNEVINKLENEGKNYILAFWHGTMILPWFLHRKKNFAALISKSKDGELLAKILNKWKYRVVRGSSHKGGSVALGVLIDLAKNKDSILITPDGPTGPPHKMKPGAVIMAKKTSLPLVLVGIGFNKKIQLKSWDSFEVPMFFSHAKVIYSDPIFIEANLSYEDTSKIIEQCEAKLNELQKIASL